MQCIEANLKNIFTAIDNIIPTYNVPCDKYVSLEVESTSENVGHHNSGVVGVRKKELEYHFDGCPCHIDHNAATDGCTRTKDFDIEELLVDIYFHFDYLSKPKKNFLLNSESTVILINARFRSSIVFAGLV